MNLLRLCGWITSCVVLLGCVSQDVRQGLKKHEDSVDISNNVEFCKLLEGQKQYGFYISADGYMRMVECRDNRLHKKDCTLPQPDGRYCKESKTRFVKILDNLEHFRESRCKSEKPCKIKIMVFVHGGLRNTSESIGRVELLKRKALEDGFFPIFLNWRSSFTSTYIDHLTRIRQGETKRYKASATALFYFVSDIARTIGNTPQAWVSEGVHAFESVNRDHQTIMADEKVTLIAAPDSPSIAVKSMASWWATSLFKVFTTPVVYTLGKPPWDVMTNRTTTMFYPSRTNFTGAGVVADHKKLCKYVGAGCTHGVAGRFLIALAEYLRERESESEDWDVTLVGHSMGVIVLNNALSSVPELEVDRVVHMASADSVDNFFLKTAPYILSSGADYYSLFLHPQREDRESSLIGLVPSGSLLVWIDNMFTTPHSITDRTAGRWDNMSRSLALMPTELQEVSSFKVFGRQNPKEDQQWDCNIGEIRDCAPQKHGDFSSARFWCPEFYFDKARKDERPDLPWCEE